MKLAGLRQSQPTLGNHNHTFDHSGQSKPTLSAKNANGKLIITGGSMVHVSDGAKEPNSPQVGLKSGLS